MEFDQNLVVNIALVALAFAFLKYMPRLTAWGIKFVDNSEVKAKLDASEDVVVIDVRTEGEFSGKTGHVPGAINLPLGNLNARLKELGEQLSPYKTLPVYVMCRTENRSSNAARSLRNAGFANLAVVKGGIKGWQRAGYPVEGAA